MTGSMVNRDAVLYTALRISTTNITLIRSDTIDKPIVPYEDCPGKFYHNTAKGGQVVSSTCLKSIGNQTNAKFLGQLDTSAVFIITGVLGDGSKNTSAKALVQKPWAWAIKNEARMSNFLLARGIMLGVNPELVMVQSSIMKPAISWLQVVLIVIPIVLALVAFLMVYFAAVGHYSSTLFQSLVATTDVRKMGDAARLKSSNNPAYLLRIPEIDLMQESHPTPGAVVLANQHGVFRFAPWSYASDTVSTPHGQYMSPGSPQTQQQWEVQQAAYAGPAQPFIANKG